ncbi:IclR family transcriptional regulator [Sinomonas mesophila]|uniref:IclR family transcriptional regulator n=1 Tax=Sinomonas mesophila TaxID=1531955 RepID=UPI000984F4B7|nr:IclR family transcriptional regulator [Sinomonas mesophila]
MAGAKGDNGTSSSSKKVLNLLFQFSAERTELSVPEMSALIGATTPSTYRYLALLKDLDLVEEGKPGHYHPTARVIPLARAAQLSNPLARIAGPMLREASDTLGETVMLQQLAGDHLVCTELAEYDRPMRFTIQPGRSTPLGRGASGKMALALLPADTRERLLPAHLSQAQLDAYLAQGYATSNSEIDEGVWACSVPIITARKSLSVLTSAGPESRIPEDHKKLTIQTLQKSAQKIRERASQLLI